MTELRSRFFNHRQLENESLTHFAIALQKIWKRLEKKDLQGYADKGTPRQAVMGQVHWTGERWCHEERPCMND